MPAASQSCLERNCQQQEEFLTVWAWEGLGAGKGGLAPRPRTGPSGSVSLEETHWDGPRGFTLAGKTSKQPGEAQPGASSSELRGSLTSVACCPRQTHHYAHSHTGAPSHPSEVGASSAPGRPGLGLPPVSALPGSFCYVLLLLLFFLARFPKAWQDTHCCPTGKSLNLMPEAFNLVEMSTEEPSGAGTVGRGAPGGCGTNSYVGLGEGAGEDWSGGRRSRGNAPPPCRPTSSSDLRLPT